MEKNRSSRVLVVHKNKPEQAPLCRQLEDNGFAVVGVQCVQQALDALRRKRIDLVCVDDSIPKQDRFDLLKMLRAQYNSEQLPALILLDEAVEKASVFTSGGDDYVVKPVTAPDLLARIEFQLARKYQTLYHKSLALLHSCDSSGKIAQVSDGWLAALGYRREEVLGRSPLEFMTQNAVRYAESVALPQFGKKGEMHDVPYQFLRKGGQVIDVLLSSRIESNPTGQIVRTHTVLRDVTEQVRMSSMLRKSERRLQRAQRLANLGFIDWNLRTDEVYWSDEFYRIYGLDPETTRPSYQATIDAVHPEDRAFVKDNIDAAKRGQKSYQITHRIVRPDGQVRHVQAQADIKLDAAGNAIEMLGVIIDITQSTQAHLALRQSEEHFRLAFETSPDAVNINRLEDGMYVNTNDGFTAITGYTQADVQGKTSLEINIWKNPKDRQRMVAQLQKEGQVKNFEAPFRAKDGHILIGLMSASPITLDGVRHIISVTRDITQLKQAEENDRLLAAIVEHSDDAIFSVSLDGVITSWNQGAQRLYGYAAGEAVGQSIGLLALPTSPKGPKKMIEKVKQGQRVERYATVRQRKDGKQIHVSITASAILGNDDQIKSVAIIARNITGRIKSQTRERQLRQELQDTAIEMAQMLSKTIDEKDAYTAGHCQRMADYSVVLARRLKLAPKKIEQLRHAALLHDVGKVGVPERVLAKAEALTDSEWTLIKKHVSIGTDLVRSIHTLKHAATIVSQHHEHWDGSGYPAGLKGEDILLEARILSVVDAYDAMITNRPYRKALSVETAREELRFLAGKQWDPAVVKTFIAMLTKPVAE